MLLLLGVLIGAVGDYYIWFRPKIEEKLKEPVKPPPQSLKSVIRPERDVYGSPEQEDLWLRLRPLGSRIRVRLHYRRRPDFQKAKMTPFKL